MRIFRGFIAASLDGYIADADGRIDWLKPFDDIDYGFDAFIAGIGAVVMGRTTYEQIPAFSTGWPYGERPGFIVTSRPMEEAYPQARPWNAGTDALIAHLRAGDDGAGGDVWVIGGAGLQAAFLAAGALDYLDIFVIPVLLGSGMPLFPAGAYPKRATRLVSTQSYPKSMVRLNYALT